MDYKTPQFANTWVNTDRGQCCCRQHFTFLVLMKVSKNDKKKKKL